MWAFQLEAPGRLVRRSAPAPTEADLAPGEVVVELAAGSVCGSDLPTFAGQRSPLLADPRAIGSPFHEVTGTVVGTRSDHLSTGQRVVGWAGGMRGLSERFVAEDSALVVVDERLAPPEATVVQPLCCAVYALDEVERLIGDLAGRRCAVVGLGTLGVLFCHVASQRGAVVVGVDPVDRSDCAAGFGIDQLVVDPSSTWAEGLAEEERPEIVIEAVGHQVGTLVDCVEAVAAGGLVYGFGVPDDPVYPLPYERLFRKSVVLTAGVTLDRRRSLERAQAYLLDHPDLPAAYLTHRLDVGDAQAAFELAARPAPGRLKVVLVV